METLELIELLLINCNELSYWNGFDNDPVIYFNCNSGNKKCLTYFKLIINQSNDLNFLFNNEGVTIIDIDNNGSKFYKCAYDYRIPRSAEPSNMSLGIGFDNKFDKHQPYKRITVAFDGI